MSFMGTNFVYKREKKILAEINTAKNTVHHRHIYIHSIRIRIFFLCCAETLRLICIRLHTHRIYWTTKHIHTPFIRTNTKERNLFGSCWFLFDYVSLSLYLSPLVCWCFPKSSFARSIGNEKQVFFLSKLFWIQFLMCLLFNSLLFWIQARYNNGINCCFILILFLVGEVATVCAFQRFNFNTYAHKLIYFPSNSCLAVLPRQMMALISI